MPISRTDLSSEIQVITEHDPRFSQYRTDKLQSPFSSAGDPYFGATMSSEALKDKLFKVTPPAPPPAPAAAPAAAQQQQQHSSSTSTSSSKASGNTKLY
jgi:hypothetical protein